MRCFANNAPAYGPPNSVYIKTASLLIILFVFAITPYTQLARAAVFLPDMTELQNTDDLNRTSQRQRIDELLNQSRNDADVIQIDDMLFKVSDLIRTQAFTGTKWTNGVVYYQFDSNVSAANRQNWLNAAAEWTAVADVTFVPRITQPNYIHVQSDSGNSSFVGMIGGAQTMRIASWASKYIIAHEIGHALGLVHEHSRSDRDSFITILTQNIEPGREHNFDIRSTVTFSEYDFDSVMHYRKNSFSSNGGNTIEPLPQYSQWLDLVGQRNYLSDLDKLGMAQRYAPPSPDLVVINPMIANTVLTPGQSFNFSAMVRNDGAGNATASTIRYYRSANTVSPGVELTSDMIQALGPNTATNEMVSLTAPSTTGIYWISACVDTVNGETDTTNNCSANVQIIVTNSLEPDLVVNALEVSNKTPNKDQSFTISATAHNQSGGFSESSILSFFQSADEIISTSDVQIGTASIPGLSPGGDSDQIVSALIETVGTYFVGACVEPVNGESQLDNQCSTGVQVVVSEPPKNPDLVVEEVTVSSSTNFSGQPFVVSSMVKNQGNRTSPLTTLRYYRSTNATISPLDTQIDSYPVPALSPGGDIASNAQVSINSSGTYYLGACIDPVIEEVFTQNQCSPGEQITIESRVDQYEPDNTSELAKIIQSRAPQNRSIVPVGDIDWVKFTLTTTTDVVLETSGLTGDTRLHLYDSGLTEIAFDDDAGINFFSKISMTNLTAGTYYVKVSEYSNNGQIESYRLSLQTPQETTPVDVMPYVFPLLFD